MGIGSEVQLIHPALVQQPSLQMTSEEADCLKELQKRIKEDEFLRDAGVEQDDEFLLAFVRGRNCNLEKALKCYYEYVTIRKVKYYTFFKGLSPRKLIYLIDENTTNRSIAKLKYPDPKGRVVGIAHARHFNPRVHKGDDLIQASVIASQEILRLHYATRHGVVMVCDATGFGLRHAKEITLSRIYMALQMFLSAYPVKYKALHVLNNPYFFDMILKGLLHFVPRKLRERIHLHGHNNFESLHKHVPREILPKSFGGLLSDEQAIDFEFEQGYMDKVDYYEKWATNL